MSEPSVWHTPLRIVMTLDWWTPARVIVALLVAAFLLSVIMNILKAS